MKVSSAQFYWEVHLHNVSSSFFSTKYVVELRTSWAKCHSRDLVIRGCDTNNYAEAQFLVLKDTILA